MTIIHSKFLSFSIFLLFSCNPYSIKEQNRKEAVRLNNKAVDFIFHHQFDSALIYLDKAVIIDSTYYLSYANKSTVYCNLKEFRKALLEAEKAIVVKPDLAEGWTIVGMLNDKNGDSLKAKSCYKRSIELYDARIANNDKKKYLEANHLNKAYSLILYGDVKQAKEEFGKLKELNPKYTSTDNLLSMNRQKILDEILEKN